MQMKRVSIYELSSILETIKGKTIDFEKLEMMKIGCQLNQLYKEDILYMADSNTSVYAAQRRMAQRRRERE